MRETLEAVIRYWITAAELNARVDAVKSNWRSRAQKRTARFRRTGTYFEPPEPIWSEIKAVFMALQNDKCAYCERQLGAIEHGKIEYDVEHFRPKNSVAAWPQGVSEYPFATGGDFPDGYYLLAYHLANYAVACKPCNTNLKSNYFPVAAVRITGKDDPADLADEKPLLIFPLGEQADDPQNLLRFEGTVPLPVSTDPGDYDYQRARVTIDFFALATREELLRERARLIFGLFIALQHAQPGSYEARTVTILTSPTHPHTNCAQCFEQLYDADRNKAAQLAEAALKYLESVHDAYVRR